MALSWLLVFERDEMAEPTRLTGVADQTPLTFCLLFEKNEDFCFTSPAVTGNTVVTQSTQGSSSHEFQLEDQGPNSSGTSLGPALIEGRQLPTTPRGKQNQRHRADTCSCDSCRLAPVHNA